jgi:hypothetical protein
MTRVALCVSTPPNYLLYQFFSNPSITHIPLGFNHPSLNLLQMLAPILHLLLEEADAASPWKVKIKADT